MICLQLYAKEIDGFPGESAAFSILSRQLNGQGAAAISGETKVRVSPHYLLQTLETLKDWPCFQYVVLNFTSYSYALFLIPVSGSR